MSSKFSIFCERVMEAGWLLAAITIPLFFDIYSSRVFEPDKLTLLRSIALMVATAWLARLFETGFADFRAGGGSLLVKLHRANPLTIPVLLVVGIYLISTLASIAQFVSIWGSYQRLQGTYSTLSYITIFAAMSHSLRSRAQLERLFTVIMLTSLPIAAYGWIQHFRLDPLPWGGDVSDRIASAMGNSIFVGAYLIMALPITLGRWLNIVSQVLREPNEGDARGDGANGSQRQRASSNAGTQAQAFDDTPYLVLAGCYTFILAFQALAIFWTFSRGAWLGGLAGLYVFVLIGLTLLRQWTPDQSRLRASEILLAIVVGVLSPLAAVVLALYALVQRGILMLKALGRQDEDIVETSKYDVSAIMRYSLRWLWLSWIVVLFVGVAFLLAINLPGTPFSSFKNIPGVGRLGQIFDPTQGTNQVRFLIWQGAAELVAPHEPIGYDKYTDIFNAVRPLIGYGPESMYVAYNKFYPPGLAQLEARNASPDRSHNETWDSLVTTGIIGFVVYITLFGSIFYHAFKWLGFASGARDRNLFSFLWVLGGAAGALIAYLIDGQPRFIGVALPVGMLLGLLTYLIVQVLFVRQHQAANLSNEDKVLLMAILSAIIGHFAEIHFGIAIASTRTYFWMYCALLVLVGLRLRRSAAEAAVPAQAVRPVKVGERVAAMMRAFDGQLTPAWSAAQAHGGASALLFARKRRRDKVAVSREIGGATAVAARAAPMMSTASNAVVTYGLMLGAVLLVMVFNFVSPNLVYAEKYVWIIALFGFTLMVGALAVVAQVQTVHQRSGGWLMRYGQILLIGVVIVGVYAVIHWVSLQRRGVNVVDSIGIVADVIAVFYLCLFTLALVLATFLLQESSQPSATLREPFFIIIYGALAVLCALGVVTSNLHSIRADIFYKQGLNFDNGRQWDGSLCMYEEAIRLAPDQDFYYLFYGRAFLEKAKATAESVPAQPLYDCRTGRPFVDPPGVNPRANQRARLIEASRVFLLRARELNPLNTDHTANLARMYRTWAEMVSETPRRAELLNEAVKYYEQAQTLSPHNAQIVNEFGSVYAMLGQTDKALAKFQESLALDKKFSQTYLLMGDLYLGKNDFENAINTYQEALKVDPELLQVHSALGLVYSRMGKYEEAIVENLQVIARQPTDYSSFRNLALLYQQTGRLVDAITYAQRAQALAPEADKPALAQYIQQLQQLQQQQK